MVAVLATCIAMPADSFAAEGVVTAVGSGKGVGCCVGAGDGDAEGDGVGAGDGAALADGVGLTQPLAES